MFWSRSGAHATWSKSISPRTTKSWPAEPSETGGWPHIGGKPPCRTILAATRQQTNRVPVGAYQEQRCYSSPDNGRRCNAKDAKGDRYRALLFDGRSMNGLPDEKGLAASRFDQWQSRAPLPHDQRSCKPQQTGMGFVEDARQHKRKMPMPKQGNSRATHRSPQATAKATNLHNEPATI